MKDLDLGQNELQNITDAFSLLHALENIKLDGNQLSEVNAQMFRNNSLLHEIDLHDNRISFIEDGSFDHLSQLVLLRLAGNVCVDEDFEIEAGDIASILPALQRCAALRDMVCSFDAELNAYECQVGDSPSFLVRSIRFQ